MMCRSWFSPILASALALALAAMPLARWLDRTLPGEPLRNSWGSLRWDEDWAKAATLPAGLNKDWLMADDRTGFRRIAHALGGAGTADANTLVALRQAQAAGMSLFEVDLWLDPNGRLRCFHGTEDGVAPPPMRPGDCTLDALLDAMVDHPGWLVLDIKTDFRTTGQSVINLLQARAGAPRVIFQLYRPDDVTAFVDWTATIALPSPIVTAYAAHRGVQHIADQLTRMGIVAMALPLDKREWLTERPQGIALFLHPVHSCAALRSSLTWGAAGGFVALRVECPQAAASTHPP